MTTHSGKTKWNDELRGAILRSLVLTCVLAICFALCFLIGNFLGIDLPNNQLLAIFVVVLFPMVGALFLSEFPRGDEFVLMRIGFATFCRTGLPLVAVMLLVRYSRSTFEGNGPVIYLVAFYAVGLLTSIGLSLYRFSGTSNSSKSQEVDSAAA